MVLPLFCCFSSSLVFLLLVFFVWTASFHVVEDSLPTTLTAELGQSEKTPPEPHPETEIDELVIRIFPKPNAYWTLNDLPLENLSQLNTRLVSIAAIKNNLNVIIHPEDEVPLGDIIDVFDTAHLAGFEKIQFATPVKSTP